MRLVMLGVPGAGKGTQADIISQRLGIPTISTGNIIREAMKNGTELGKKVKESVQAGGLAPDQMVIELIAQRIAEDDCKNGFILDGFPRTLPQAQALDEMGVVVDKVIDIEVEDHVIIARLGGRLTCSTCSTTFHVKYNPPKTPGVCDKCGGELTQRADDKPETVLERLKIYHEQTEPLKEYYQAAGKLYLVQGQEDSVEGTTRLTLAALEA